MEQAYIALISLFVGAFLQYFFTRLNQKEDYKNKLLMETCIEYLESISDLKFGDPKNMNSYLSKYLKAKERIILYGSMRLVDFLYKFETTDKILGNDTANTAFLDLVEEMRLNVFDQSSLSKKMISKILIDNSSIK